MAATCETRDGKTITDGDRTTLTLAYGTYTAEHERLGQGKAGEPVEVKVKGVVRAFEQDGETRWEVVTSHPQWPAVGFIPENAITRTGS